MRLKEHKSGFFRLSNGLLALNQSEIVIISEFRVFDRKVSNLRKKKTFVSSAKRVKRRRCDEFEISLM